MLTSREAGPNPIDVYLKWAFATDFKFYLTPSWLRSVGDLVGLLIEWNSLEAASSAVELAEKRGVIVPEIYKRSGDLQSNRFWAISVPMANVRAFVEEAAPLAKRIELAAPVGPFPKKSGVRR